MQVISGNVASQVVPSQTSSVFKKLHLGLPERFINAVAVENPPGPRANDHTMELELLATASDSIPYSLIPSPRVTARSEDPIELDLNLAESC